ncbi:response regulator [Vibrio cyclitrophicus]|uniref:response regulator n=1 Tax=Vibrio splendidus TaxID=29497 RepID=UPI00206F1C6F|nr:MULTISPECIES: response regulator [Vibrio]UPR52826.1 response regulator [Vibrio cyclitrophicus]UWZ98140.1 response regulator [Vibrio splendidus]
MSEKILVVEDSRAFRNYLYQQLKNSGYEVAVAESIAEAKKILEQETDFLCAVLDYCLPDGQDGEIIDLVLGYQQKIIVLTGMFDNQLREQVLAKGVIDYILKDSMSSVSYLLPLVQRISNNRHHKALVVDDSAVVRRYIAQLLEHQYIQTIQAEDGEQALKLLNNDPDITFVVTDHDMPKKDGIAMIREIRRDHDRNQLAILGLSGSDDRTMTARFLKAGANDFLYKPFNQEEFFCRIHQLLDMKEAANELFRHANEDALTGLWNRRYLFNNTCKGCDQRNIAMMDIDFFKKVNDTFGHDGGDAVLVDVGKIIKDHFKDDVAVRFGGEEFCIQSCGAFENFVDNLESMREAIESHVVEHDSQRIKVSISIGVTDLDAKLDEQIKAADELLYTAKEQGRNQLVFARNSMQIEQ